MIRICIISVVFASMLAGPAVGQVAQWSQQSEPTAAAKAKQKRTASFCNGGAVLPGRWRIQCSGQARTRGTIIVRNDLTLRRSRDSRERIDTLSWSRPVTGGALRLNNPILDRSSDAFNRCFVTGQIEAGKKRVVITEAFIVSGAALMTGEAYVDGPLFEGACTLTKY